MELKATFTVGVFGLACRQNDGGVPQIKVNVRGDQARQHQLAGLPEDSSVLIVDMPGGGVLVQDFPNLENADLLHALRREIMEETGGCQISPLSDAFSGPFLVVTNTADPAKNTGDIAFWIPVKLLGVPLPTNEAAAHPWVSEAELISGDVYRPVGKLGMAGRTGRMLMQGFFWYGMNAHKDVFS